MGELFAFIAASIISALMTNQANKDLMSDQQKYNTDVMDKQNQYNSPVEQVNRLQNAGINPTNMGMASGQIQGGQSAPANPLQLLPMSDPLLSASNGVLSMASAYHNKEQGKDLSSTREARILQTKELANLYRQNAQNYNLKNAEQEIVNQYANMRELWAVNGLKASAFANYAQANKFQVEYKSETYRLEHILPAELIKIIADTGVSIWDQSRIMAEIHDFETHSKKNEAETQESEARAGLLDSQKSLTEQQTETERFTTTSTMYGSRIKGVEANYSSELQDLYLRQYNASIANLEANTGLTKEETYWKVFDEMDKTSLTIFGNKVPRGRFGERMYKKATKQAFKEKLPN